MKLFFFKFWFQTKFILHLSFLFILQLYRKDEVQKITIFNLKSFLKILYCGLCALTTVNQSAIIHTLSAQDGCVLAISQPSVIQMINALNNQIVSTLFENFFSLFAFLKLMCHPWICFNGIRRKPLPKPRIATHFRRAGKYYCTECTSSALKI